MKDLNKDKLKPLSLDHLNELFNNDLTLGQKIADQVAVFVGSWKFIICFSTFLHFWILYNLFGHFLGSPTIDPPPFILLNLLLSFVAAYQAPLILMSQNRSAQRDRARDEIQYDVTQEIRTELFMIHEDINLVKEEISKKKK